MIYLVDDKKNRQIGYGWDNYKFELVAKNIKPIYTYEEILKGDLRKDIFCENNIVFFHESFFDNQINSHDKESLDIRKDLELFASKNSNFFVAFFSGSKNNRIQTKKNICYLPVSILYQNLDCFIENYNSNNIDFRYVLFGKNPEIEASLESKLNDANNEIDSLVNFKTNSKSLFFISSVNYISKPLPENSYDEAVLYDDVEDNGLSNVIFDNLFQKQYDNIFLPLCFGATLSDFNGLRLATHIRCTENPNQLKNIFIYSFIDYSYLTENEYFDILKTKNVKLIEYKRFAFQIVIQTQFEPLSKNKLSNEIKKINLTPPKNYEDSHSIANEWAIFRWASAIGATDEQIAKITKGIKSQIYFKYLSTINPINEIELVKKEALKINVTGSPKILYIDDEADKGWYEIFCNILYDINNIDFNYLCAELKNKSQNEIIALIINEITQGDIDIVILDFRLHPNDFEKINIQEVTGLKVLKEIKNKNPGIQVIIFSATNKVWNFQALQDAGADGFILKESPDFNSNLDISKISIEKLILSISRAINMYFLKKVYVKITEIESLISVTNDKEESEFRIRLLNNLGITFKLLTETRFSSKYFNYAFLQLFQIIEDFSKLSYVFSEGSDSYVGVNEHFVCVNKTFRDNWETAISFTDKYKLNHKLLPIKEKKKRLDTNYIVSAILIFRLGYDNSSALSWTEIYTIRNTKAAHFNVEDALKETEIYTILNFIKNFINPNKQKESNIDKGLKIKSYEESVELLKSHFTNL